MVDVTDLFDKGKVINAGLSKFGINNPSFGKWAGYMLDIPVKVRIGVGEATRKEAEKIVKSMKAAVPVDSGKLRDSIRSFEEKGKVKIVAGGDLTTKEVRKGSGKPYDYARAVEFGAQDQPAQPFFYSTVERAKEGFLVSIRTVFASILRSSN